MKSILKTIFIFILFVSTSFSKIINVPADISTIQGGIDLATNGDTVLVSEDRYYENVSIYGKSITLASLYLIDDDSSHISNTIIDGSQPVDTDYATTVIISSSQETTVLCGFTITGGFGTKWPAKYGLTSRSTGGVGVGGSNAIVEHNIITGNIINSTTVPDAYDWANAGGITITPLDADSVTVIVRNNRIYNNQVEGEHTDGGGIGIGYGKDDQIFNFIVEQNIIENNVVINTDGWKAMGGGLSLMLVLPTKGEQIIRNNIFRGNKVLDTHSFGGAMYIVFEERNSEGTSDDNPGPLIYNNLIVDNHSDYIGGAISVWRAYFPSESGGAEPLTSMGKYIPKPSFINNTIVNNSAQVDGGGFFIMNHIPFLMNNILWNIYPDTAEWGEIYIGDEPFWLNEVEANQYGNVEIYYSDIQGGWEGEGNMNQNPIFKFPAHDEYDLDKYSPCISAGISSFLIGNNLYVAPEEDFYGRSRPEEDVDMGALESTFDKDMNELVLYLSFDDSTANDASGYENHGIPIGEPRDTTGILGNAFYFDGSSKIRIPDSESLDTDTSMTIALWIRPDSVTAEGAKFMCKWYSFRQQGDWLFSLSSRDSVHNGDKLVQWAGYAANYGQFGGHCSIGVPRDSINSYLKLHRWQHIAITFDRGYMCSYVNGQFVDDSMSTVGYTSLHEYNTDDIYIGGYRKYYEGYKFFGSLDELRIYDRALTAAEVKSLFDYVTVIEDKTPPANVPHKCTLFQNYPNPFNPTTAIDFDLPKTSNVKLKIFNILGEEIATLVSDKLSAGTYAYDWDASNLASGVYLYRLEAGDFIQTKKMILMR